jgi:hypothetical protein
LSNAAAVVALSHPRAAAAVIVQTVATIVVDVIFIKKP